MNVSKTASIKVSALFALPLLSSMAFSAPNIQSVEADPIDSQALTITGNGFSTPEYPIILDTGGERKVLQQPYITDSFSVEEFWLEEGSPWANPLQISSGESLFGQTDNVTYYGKMKAFNGYFQPYQDETNRSLYVSWWFKPTVNPSAYDGSNKFIRIWDDSNGNNTRISWTNMHLTYGASDLNTSGVSWGTWSGNVNEWNLMEIYVDADNNSIQAYVNGNLLHNVTDFGKSPIDKGLNAKLLGFDPSIPDPYANFEFHVDNIYVSTTRSKVATSTYSNWDSAKGNHRALFTREWTDNQIKVDLGSNAADGGDFYVYVIDNAGNVNSEGFPLCLKCPSSIDNVGVD